MLHDNRTPVGIVTVTDLLRAYVACQKPSGWPPRRNRDGKAVGSFVDTWDDCVSTFLDWLLLDSRVVDVPMASNPIFVTLSSLKPFFFNGLKNELRFSDHGGA